MRIMHEASLHEHNWFVTLTYDYDHMPRNESGDIVPTLVHRDFQLFMKRLRKKYGQGIKYYMCGEYGEKNNRPHYHAILFNVDFPDKVLHPDSSRGNSLYVSSILDAIWDNGMCVIGNVTFQSAAYVARYVMKKRTGDNFFVKQHYQRFDSNTGEIFDVEPEYARMSLNPAIGKDWFKTFKDDVYPSDFHIMNGVKVHPPKYYDILYSREINNNLTDIKEKRIKRAKAKSEEYTPERLAVREKCARSRTKSLRRDIV